MYKHPILDEYAIIGSFLYDMSKPIEDVIIHPDEYIIIIDCSGSMKGKPLELAIEALTFFVKSLPEKSPFNVIKFEKVFYTLF